MTDIHRVSARKLTQTSTCKACGRIVLLGRRRPAEPAIALDIAITVYEFAARTGTLHPRHDLYVRHQCTPS